MGLIARALAAWILAMAGPAAATPPRAVVVVKRGGVTAYEDATEEFAERCRVRVRTISFGDEGPRPGDWALAPDELVVAVGQEALDALAGSPARVIPALAFHLPMGMQAASPAPSPSLLLRLLGTARRAVRAVGAVHGPRSAATLAEAQREAQRVGLTLEARPVADGPAAVRALRQLAGRVDAIWLPPDADVVTPQVFQYALRLQIERGLPLLAGTRQQVHSGALLAVDLSPRAAGRAAAELVNTLLEGRPARPDVVDVQAGARITVNARAARRLGIDTSELRRLGAEVE